MPNKSTHRASLGRRAIALVRPLALVSIACLSIAFLFALPALAVDPPSITLVESSDPLTLRFDVDTPSPGVVYLWSFGDGASSFGETVVHSYASPGHYVVDLLVDDGSSQTVESRWLPVGYELDRLDFEDELVDSDWIIDGLELGSAIEGSGGAEQMIVQPNPGPSCGIPIKVPPDGSELPNGPRGWTLSLLVDLKELPIDDGSTFDLLRVLDASVAPPIFGVRVEASGGHWLVAARAVEGATLDVVETVPAQVPPGPLYVELQAQIGSDFEGGLRLRVVDWLSGDSVVVAALDQLANQDRAFSQFVFGMIDADLPSLSDAGSVRLDDFKVLTGTCLAPAPDGLLGHWDFEDPQNPWDDSSGAGRHATARGTVATTTGRSIAGGVETALELTGTGFLEIPGLGVDFQGATEVTVEAWTRVATQPQMNVFRLQQPVSLRSDGVSVANYATGGGWSSAYAPQDPAVDRWVHIVGVFDHGHLSFYVDGALAAEQALSFSELQGTPTALWAIGARALGGGAGDQHFVGLIDDVRVYERALTSSEIAASAGRCGL